MNSPAKYLALKTFCLFLKTPYKNRTNQKIRKTMKELGKFSIRHKVSAPVMPVIKPR